MTAPSQLHKVAPHMKFLVFYDAINIELLKFTLQITRGTAVKTSNILQPKGEEFTTVCIAPFGVNWLL